MTPFKKMVQQYWMTNYPKESARLKRLGMFEQLSEETAEAAREEYDVLLQNGANQSGAMEIVMKEYIMLPPEIIE